MLLSPALASPVLARPAGAAPISGTALAVAQRRAADLRSRVDQLRTTAEVATEDYDAAQSRLADLVTQHLLAARQLADQQATSAGDHQVADDRVRAIYMTGGTAGLVNSVLGAHDLGDAAARLHTVQSLIGDDRSRVATGTAATGQAAAIETRLATLSTQQAAIEQQAAAASTRVSQSLATSQQLLADAGATVRKLAEQQRQAAQAAAARAFAIKLTAAQSAAAARLEAAAARVPGHRSPPTGAGPAGALDGTGTASSQGAAAVAAARTRLGDPYVWGATGPDAFDCSGLTGWAYRQAGLGLPRTSRQQWSAGPRVALGELSPGDLLFWASDPSQPATIHHVALYVGGGLMIAAPEPGDVVKVQAVYLDGYAGAVRPRA